MINFFPDNKKAVRAMIRRIGFLILCIIVIIIFYLPNFTVYGGIGFITYGEAFSFFISEVWESFINGNIMLLPIRLIFLPFFFVWDCSRPGCEWMGLFMTVVYYTFWFYLTIIVKKSLLN